MKDRKNIKVIDLDGEIWKEIPDFEGIYSISNKLRVKSMLRKGVNGISITEKILRPGKHKSGYAKFTFCKNGDFHFFNRHRLIAQVFIPNPNNYPCVNHIDGNPGNDSISNLEWCTFSHNTRVAYKMERISKVGNKNHMAKLTESAVIEIFNFIGDKSLMEKKYSISKQTINDIKTGRRWHSVTGKRHWSVKNRICEEG